MRFNLCCLLSMKLRDKILTSLLVLICQTVVHVSMHGSFCVTITTCVDIWSKDLLKILARNLFHATLDTFFSANANFKHSVKVMRCYCICYIQCVSLLAWLCRRFRYYIKLRLKNPCTVIRRALWPRHLNCQPPYHFGRAVPRHMLQRLLVHNLQVPPCDLHAVRRHRSHTVLA